MTYFVSLPGNKKDPPAGPAPAWSALRERRISDFCHGGIKVVRPVGTAPTSPAWKAEILLLNDGRFLKMAAGVGIAPTSRALQARAHLSKPSSGRVARRIGAAPTLFPD